MCPLALSRLVSSGVSFARCIPNSPYLCSLARSAVAGSSLLATTTCYCFLCPYATHHAPRTAALDTTHPSRPSPVYHLLTGSPPQPTPVVCLVVCNLHARFSCSLYVCALVHEDKDEDKAAARRVALSGDRGLSRLARSVSAPARALATRSSSRSRLSSFGLEKTAAGYLASKLEARSLITTRTRSTVLALAACRRPLEITSHNPAIPPRTTLLVVPRIPAARFRARIPSLFWSLFVVAQCSFLVFAFIPVGRGARGWLAFVPSAGRGPISAFVVSCACVVRSRRCMEGWCGRGGGGGGGGLYRSGRCPVVGW
ncbi:hypothetical protein C8T65DRAFT_283672 [Cerioporus squamosus]|nr:hypothetical protein C8T65DRAFT_283672 [Cerioporus squamosus]